MSPPPVIATALDVVGIGQRRLSIDSIAGQSDCNDENLSLWGSPVKLKAGIPKLPSRALQKFPSIPQNPITLTDFENFCSGEENNGFADYLGASSFSSLDQPVTSAGEACETFGKRTLSQLLDDDDDWFGKPNSESASVHSRETRSLPRRASAVPSSTSSGERRNDAYHDANGRKLSASSINTNLGGQNAQDTSGFPVPLPSASEVHGFAPNDLPYNHRGAVYGQRSHDITSSAYASNVSDQGLTHNSEFFSQSTGPLPTPNFVFGSGPVDLNEGFTSQLTTGDPHIASFSVTPEPNLVSRSTIHEKRQSVQPSPTIPDECVNDYDAYRDPSGFMDFSEPQLQNNPTSIPDPTSIAEFSYNGGQMQSAPTQASSNAQVGEINLGTDTFEPSAFNVPSDAQFLSEFECPQYLMSMVGPDSAPSTQHKEDHVVRRREDFVRGQPAKSSFDISKSICSPTQSVPPDVLDPRPLQTNSKNPTVVPEEYMHTFPPYSTLPASRSTGHTPAQYRPQSHAPSHMMTGYPLPMTMTQAQQTVTTANPGQISTYIAVDPHSITTPRSHNSRRKDGCTSVLLEGVPVDACSAHVKKATFFPCLWNDDHACGMWIHADLTAVIEHLLRWHDMQLPKGPLNEMAMRCRWPGCTEQLFRDTASLAQHILKHNGQIYCCAGCSAFFSSWQSTIILHQTASQCEDKGIYEVENYVPRVLNVPPPQEPSSNKRARRTT
ncbi:hypothetical protein BJ138DRAFT_1164649 [Hygrophoropsis aurantiaca]|uniref:Uncharacterized protein n=1 Tax=Hygrophoropsis aurantiaca TaxID=72124 RepID=A0ACB7ZXY8_9AGAM|nr:hypothetical protein BJ138DRAFT_1164649 [Hygrophoropsis aurantiaca]